MVHFMPMPMPGSIQENSLWVCTSPHYTGTRAFSLVKQGTIALLHRIDRVPGNVHFIVEGDSCTMDWSSFVNVYAPAPVQSANRSGPVV